MKKAGTDNVQCLLFFGIQIKICKKITISRQEICGDLLKNEKMVDFFECVCYNKNNQMEKHGRRNEKNVAFCV